MSRSASTGLYLYLAEFGPPLTKVGITAEPEQRTRQHRYFGKCVVKPLCWVWISEHPHVEARANETALKWESDSEFLPRDFNSCLAQAIALPMTFAEEPSYMVELLAPATLRQFLKFTNTSYGQLAFKAGCSKALIVHLASGRNLQYKCGHCPVDLCRS